MRDFILCFDSVDQAQQAGYEFAVSGSRNGMATCVIGSHQFIESGNFFSDGKFWVMVLTYAGSELKDAVEKFIVARDPSNVRIPQQVWA